MLATGTNLITECTLCMHDLVRMRYVMQGRPVLHMRYTVFKGEWLIMAMVE